ncbi:hypothetical protein QZH41_012240 [Actinostola sp. cb2023]|nr:hypothetical protein QZH41_012240 [Actinostola sp. cb2023]
MPLISIVNSLLKYGLNMLKLRFRTRLTLYLTEQYLSGFTYYKMTNLDNRIANADQLLTQDVDKFCTCLADLYSNVSKPLLDIVIYVHKLSGAIGFQDTDRTRTRYGHDTDTDMTRIRHGYDTDTTWTRHGHDTDRTRTRYGHDTDTDMTRTRHGHDTDMTRILHGYDTDTTRTRHGHDTDMTRI